MDADLRSLLEVSRFGTIGLSQRTSDVHQLLGDADDVARLGAGIVIWKYGMLELTFDHDQLQSINLYWRGDDERLPPLIAISGFFPSHETSIGDFYSFLEQNEITARLDSTLTFGDQVCLVVGNGAQVVFSDSGQHLASIQVVKYLVNHE